MSADEDTVVKTPEEILGMWADVRVELEDMDKDIHKSMMKGNTAAGRRSRARFREVRKAVAALIREMVKVDKARVAEKKAKKQAQQVV